MELLRKLAESVMTSRKQAIITAMAFVFIPLMGWLSVVIMGLVTLRKGTKEGFIVLLWIILPSTILGLTINPLIFFVDVVFGSVTVWLLASVLRHTQSWSNVIQLVTGISILSILVFHALHADTVQWWQTYLENYFKEVNGRFQMGLDNQLLTTWATQTSRVATQWLSLLLVFVNLFNLLIARWLQAMLYNPGGLRQELYRVRLGTAAEIVLILMLIAALSQFTVALDAMPVTVVPFVLAGISLVHGLVFAAKWPVIWLICFYGLFILIFPIVLVVLIVAVMLDTWCNFRGRLGLA